jgi:fatty-acyl-CoA synthase
MSSASISDLRLHAAAAPDRVAIACGDERLSYGELEALANRLAAVLRARGLRRGEHIASLLGNRLEGLALAWAAWRTGLYLTPVSTALASAEVRYLVTDCDARAVLVDAELAPLASSVGWT